MDLIAMIKPELLIVSVVLYLIGFGLKKIKKLKDNFIPLILTVIGIAICFVYIGIANGFTWQALASGAVQGVLVAAASTYVHQVIKQMKELGVNKTVTTIAETLVEKTQEENKEN